MSDRTANLLGVLGLAVADRIEAAAREIMDHAGETPAAVVVVGYGPGMTNDKLRRILRLSHPGCVRLIDRLVEDGLVERRAGRDKRETALHLTRRGTAMREKLLAGRLAAIRPLLSPLSPAENEQLATLIHKTLCGLNAEIMERYTLCRLCDDRVCTNCPIPAPKGPAA
jgi:MarR family transcriptional regulator, negative regulator of the multidrug operon emrRAB